MSTNSPASLRIEDLPTPPAGREGWPWTERAPSLPARSWNGKPWPRISVVTPSFNQGNTIEETIRSVLLQGYPNLEYRIIDGGSNDETLEIIKAYEPWIDAWISKPDRGQSDAINRGFHESGGEVFNWLCSDDFLMPGALACVGTAFADADCDVFSGACDCVYESEPQRNKIRSPAGSDWQSRPWSAGIWQPSTFWRSDLIRGEDAVLEDLKVCMDRELWCRLLAAGANWVWSDECLSTYRFTGGNKSTVMGERAIDEIIKIYQMHLSRSKSLPVMLKHGWLPSLKASKSARSPMLRSGARLAARFIAACALAIHPRDHVRSMQREFHGYAFW